MKKTIIAAAAIVLMGNTAFAEFSITGSGGMGIKYEEDADVKYISDLDVKFSGSGTTDGGLTFGGAVTVKGGNGSSEVGKSNVSIGGDMWTISIGDLDPASHASQVLPDVGFDGLGVDDVAEKAVDGTAADISLALTFGGATISYTTGTKAASEGTLANAYVDAWFNTQTQTAIIDPNDDDEEDVIWNPEIPTVDITTAPDDLVGTYFRKAAEPGVVAPCRDMDYNTFAGGVDDMGDPVGDDADGDPNVHNALAGDWDTPTRDGVDLDDDDDLMADDQRTRKITHKAMCSYKGVTEASNEWALGVSFEAGAMTVGLGIDGNDLMSAGVSAEISGISTALYFEQAKVMMDGKEVNMRGTGVSVGFAAGEGTNLTLVVAQDNMEDEDNQAFGVGMTYDLGGGASFNTGFASVRGQTAASAGVAMTF